jgi:Ca-activated chloride channel family protein
VSAVFDSPVWFWLLALVPALAVFYVLALRARLRALTRLLGAAGRERLAERAGRSRRALEAALGALTVGIVALALAGPRWGIDEHAAKRRGADVMVVLDTSRSMLAQDVTPSRIERAKREIRGLIDEAGGDRIGLVTFAGDARLVCPLTLDHDTLSLFVDEVDPSFDHRGGSAIAPALEIAGDALEGSSGAGKAIVILSDGEDHEDSAGSAASSVASALAAKGIQVHAIALGTESGAKIPVVDDQGRTSFFQDASGKEVVTKANPAALRAAAAAGKGEMLTTAAAAFPMDELWAKRISRLAKGDTGTESLSEKKARFQWFLLAALLSGALWWAVSQLALFRARAPAAAAAGPAIARPPAIAAAILLLLVPSIARADAVDEGAKGDELYRKGDWAGAAAAYQYAESGTGSEHASFNLGNARFRQKSFRQAAKSWSDAERKASDPATRRDADYNRGLALLHAADGSANDRVETLKSSVDAFDDALRLDPNDADARHDRAIAIARWVDAQKPPASPQQQQSKDPSQGGKQDPKQSQQSRNGDQKKNDGKSQDQPGQQQAANDRKKQDPDANPKQDPNLDSGRLDRLERMLDDREKEQRKIEQQKARMVRQPGENDW